MISATIAVLLALAERNLVVVASGGIAKRE
jgi:hypothetical protein